MGAIPERDDAYRPRVPMPRQFRHLPSKLIYADRLPPIPLASDSVERQDMPASWLYPSADVFILRNLATVDVESVQLAITGDRVVGSQRLIVRRPPPSACLLVSRSLYRLCKVTMRTVKRIAKRRDLHPHPAFN